MHLKTEVYKGNYWATIVLGIYRKITRAGCCKLCRRLRN